MTLREQFEAMDVASVQGFLGVQEENLHLDFKQLGPNPFGGADDRRNLAKVLSGFANSDGGICVWGVDSRKNADGADVANRIAPIANLAATVSRLNELTSSGVNPAVDGVMHKAIATEGAAGVIATLIPASDSGPHMGKLGEDRYYKRSGGSFLRLEHFDLEDMFGRRARPVLSVVYEVRQNGSKTDDAGKTILQFLAVISIRNSGRGPAEAPFLALFPQLPHRHFEFGLDGNGGFGLPRMSTSRFSKIRAFGGKGGQMIYPGVDLDVTCIDLHFPDGRFRDASISYRLAAANSRMIEGELIVKTDDIMQARYPE